MIVIVEIYRSRIDSINGTNLITSYSMDYSDAAQRRTFAIQCAKALEAGQTVITHRNP